MSVLSNFHMHTTMCDGSDTPEAMAEAAFGLGFTCVGFSGHMDPDIHMDWEAYTAEIHRLQQLYAGRMEIFMGTELDNLYPPSEVPGAEYIIGSTHFLDVPPIDGHRLSVDASYDDIKLAADTYFDGDYYKLCRAYFDFEAKVGERTGCTFVGHFDLVTRFNDDEHYVDEHSRLYLDPALEAMEYLARDCGLPFEINCGAYNRARKADFYPATTLLRALHDFGGRIIISSDAHDTAHIGSCLDEAAEQAASCGFTSRLELSRGADGAVGFVEVPL